MLDQMIRTLTLDLIRAAASHPDPGAGARLAEAFWDLQYLHRTGLSQVPGLDLLPRKQIVENSDRLCVHEDVLFSLANAVIGGSESQPGTPNIMSVLSNQSLRLASVERLSGRLAEAINLLRAEAVRLESGLSVLTANRFE